MPDDIREQLVTHLEMPLRAQSLVEGLSLSTAFSNDAQPQLAMAQQLLGSARRGDLLIAISTSGNSENILLAAYLARAIGVSVLALTGGTGGALRAAADIAVVVPGSTTAEIQEFHLPVYHCLCAAAEAYFF
jgi:D-sedoheptulose 7-phosphate isomerase